MRYSLIAADASISEGRRYPAGGRGSKRECEIEDCVIYKAQEVTSVPLMVTAIKQIATVGYKACSIAGKKEINT